MGYNIRLRILLNRINHWNSIPMILINFLAKMKIQAFMKFFQETF